MKSFGDFASLAGSVVMHAGFSNPFEKREEISGGDSAGLLIRELITTAADLLYSQVDELRGLSEPERVCQLALRPDLMPMEHEYSVPDLLGIAVEELGTADRLTWGVKEDQRSKSLGLKLSNYKGNIYKDKYGREFEFGRVKRTSTTKYTFTWLKPKMPAETVARAEADLRANPPATPFD
jgi:hypothetical protein